MIRVLFVDDEPRILNGLRRMLRTRRHEWEMEFVTSGQDALAAMEGDPFDVVVSDMKMPGMNGVELMAVIRERHPESIRMILSGHSERTQIAGVVDRTHQYLAKPCEPDVLMDAIERAYALRSVLESDALKAMVSRLDHLPSIPSLYQDVVAELDRAEPSPRRVGKIIESDMGMSTTILKLVNSAFFGVKRSLSSVERAVGFLGMDTIKTLVLGHGIFRQFDGSLIPRFSLDAVWAHSLRSARFANAIAQREGLDADCREQCFTAGSLHEVGKLILAANCPLEFGQVLEELQRYGGASAPVERAVMGVTHGEVGAYLLGLWGLPESVVEAVTYHTAPSDSIAPVDALSVVHVSDVLALHPGFDEPDPEDLLLDIDYLREAGLEQKWRDWRAMCVQLEPMEGAA